MLRPSERSLQLLRGGQAALRRVRVEVMQVRYCGLCFLLSVGYFDG